MIVEPDFPDHWKTKLLVQLTGDEAAPLCLIRLWCHCHARRACYFENLSDDALAAICQWKKTPSVLREALFASGYLVLEPDGSYYVHDWDKTNFQLVKNWINGPKGGRPKKDEKPSDNPEETQKKPSDNPARTEGLEGRIGVKDGGEKPEGRQTDSDDSELKPKGIGPVLEFGASLQLSEDECRKFYDHNQRKRWNALTKRSDGEPLLGWRRLLEIWKENLQPKRPKKLRAKKTFSSDGGEFDPTKPNAHTGGLAFA